MRSSSWARNDGFGYAVHPQRPGVGCRQGRLRPVGHLIETYGLALLFLVVALEAAGVPVPGETALIAASALASQGYFDIVWVIAVAAAAAIVGDNVGYWIGRMGGRSLLSHSPFIARYTERVLPWGERFFARHGGKTVFFARFITGLRVAGAWIAGITGMRWWRFLFWNAAGGIVWATVFGLLAYYLGHAAVDMLHAYGFIGAVIIIVVAGVLIGMRSWLRRRLERGET